MNRLGRRPTPPHASLFAFASFTFTRLWQWRMARRHLGRRLATRRWLHLPFRHFAAMLIAARTSLHHPLAVLLFHYVLHRHRACRIFRPLRLEDDRDVGFILPETDSAD